MSATLFACCPVPLQAAPTAFRANIVGISPELSALHLATPDQPLMTVVVTAGALRSSTGDQVALTAFRAGDAVYVQGSLQNGELSAAEVRQLE